MYFFKNLSKLAALLLRNSQYNISVCGTCCLLVYYPHFTQLVRTDTTVSYILLIVFVTAQSTVLEDTVEADVFPHPFGPVL